MDNIKGIIVEVEKIDNDTINVYYHTVDKWNSWKWYNAKNAPINIIEMVKQNKPVKTWTSETQYKSGKTKYTNYIYKF